MSDARCCLACGQPLAAGSTCSECGTDDRSFEALRALPPDSRRDRAVVMLFFFMATGLILFVTTQIGPIALFSWIGGAPSQGIFLWWTIAGVLLSAWFLFIAFQFSRWPMRIAQVLLVIPFLWTIWPWLQDLMGVLEMPDRIRALGQPLTDLLGRLYDIVSPFHLVAPLLLIGAFLGVARELCLPRSRHVLWIAFWLVVVQFLTVSVASLVRHLSGNTMEPPWIFRVTGTLSIIFWLGSTVLLLVAAFGMRRRVRRLRPPSSHPS